MALLVLEEDPWLLEYESCEKLQRNIMGQLTERQRFPRTSSRYAQLSADIRLKLKQYNNEMKQLKEKLEICSRTITEAETERRNRQVEVLMTKAIQMQKMFDEQLLTKRMEERRDLFGPNTGDWDDLNSGPSNMSVQQIQARQKEMINAQEQGLESLAKIISRQKQIANTITSEVEQQNDIIDDIGIQIDNTDQRVRTETDHIGIVDKKDSTCGYWIVIIILFISIIVVVAL
ncbi:hypothetical protein ABEB36_001664 [Hypothenemus hampei]|uniref:t-SNARE coiled-coil homology domain-containing protein n=1 Tax=Hypothenemus hampei TaxID=57062 RepID=A0ABD1FGA6_HYPHA